MSTLSAADSEVQQHGALLHEVAHVEANRADSPFRHSRERVCEETPRPVVHPVDSPHLTHICSSYRPFMFLSTRRKFRITRMPWDFFTHSKAGIQDRKGRVLAAYPPRADGLPRAVIAAPLRHSRESGNPGRGRTGPWPTSQALRPHGSRKRDANMDSRFRGNDGRGGVSASSRWPSSGRHRSPPRHSRESGNPGRERTGLWRPPRPTASLEPSSQAPRPHGNRNRDTNMDSRFRGNDGRGGAYPPRADGLRHFPGRGRG